MTRRYHRCSPALAVQHMINQPINKSINLYGNKMPNVIMIIVRLWKLTSLLDSDCRSEPNIMLSINPKIYTSYSKCLNKWIGSDPIGTEWYNFQPSIQTLGSTMHNVTDIQTDRHTDDITMPIADHTKTRVPTLLLINKIPGLFHDHRSFFPGPSRQHFNMKTKSSNLPYRV